MPTPRKRPRTYAAAGVDIDRGDALVDYIKTLAGGIGGFSAAIPIPRGYKSPRLIASTDGVGTKLLVAQAAGRHDTIGIDLVAMVVNDLIVCGAKPLFFLDYFATGRLRPAEARAVLAGIVEGCRRADCPLVGGETAEMPGMYGPGHYDLAGFGVGIVDADRMLDGRGVRPGDLVLGLASSGLHSNGYSLARDVLMPKGAKAAKTVLRKKLFKGGPTVGEALLAPTRIYARAVLDLMRRFPVVSAANITGGGIEGNLARMLPAGVTAFIDAGAWKPPPIFAAIAERGPVEEAEMFRTFNMGIGFILVVRPEAAKQVRARAAKLGEQCLTIGWIGKAPRKSDAPGVLLVRREIHR
jgi:phosphoribosylformylglycinamidine cyclo-ligase